MCLKGNGHKEVLLRKSECWGVYFVGGRVESPPPLLGERLSYRSLETPRRLCVGLPICAGAGEKQLASESRWLLKPLLPPAASQCLNSTVALRESPFQLHVHSVASESPRDSCPQ